VCCLQQGVDQGKHVTKQASTSFNIITSVTYE